MNKSIKNFYSILRKKRFCATSNTDLLKAVDTNIVAHKDLYKYNNIDQIIRNNACIIFYDHTAGDIGHWCCLTKRGNLIEYFDSYGRKPSYPKYIHGDPPYLANLLKNSGYRVTYNPYEFQGNSAACGRHVVMRILLKTKPLSFYKNFMSGMDPDDLVSFFTAFI